MNASNNSFTFSSDIPLRTLPYSKEHLIFRYVFALISITVNFFVIILVACSKQLHLPRHTFWAGTSLIILFCTAQWILELFLNPETNLAGCVIFELSIGAWYPALLLFLSLAGLDRFLAIRYYEWYKRSATNKRATIVMLITWVLNAIITNSPYWSGYKALTNCTANQTHLYLISTWNVVLGIVNIILQSIIFIESRKAIREYSINQTGPNMYHRYLFRDPQVFTISIELRCYGSNQRQSAHDLFVMNATCQADQPATGQEHVEARLQPTGQAFNLHCFPWGKAQRTGIARLDFRAALILSVNVLPFWLFTFPLAFYVMAIYWCSKLQLDCSYELLIQADGYVKFLFYFPCIYMPVMYMMNSSELQRALKHLFKKIETRANSLNHTCNRPMN